MDSMALTMAFSFGVIFFYLVGSFVQYSLKNAEGAELVKMRPLIGTPPEKLVQVPLVRFVVICNTKFVPVAVGKNTAGELL
jgi:hypothetical protein